MTQAVLVTTDVNGAPMGPYPIYPYLHITDDSIFVVWGEEEDGEPIFDRIPYSLYGHDAYVEAAAIIVREGFTGWWELDDQGLS